MTAKKPESIVLKGVRMKSIGLSILITALFPLQGCWLDSSPSQVEPESQKVIEEKGATEGQANQSDKKESSNSIKNSEHKIQNKQGVDIERFRELFLGSYRPASKGYWGQGDLIITKDTITWKGCNNAPYKITNQRDSVFFIEIQDEASCDYHGQSISHMRFSIIRDGMFEGNFKLALYRKKDFPDGPSLIYGIMGPSE